MEFTAKKLIDKKKEPVRWARYLGSYMTRLEIAVKLAKEGNVMAAKGWGKFAEDMHDYLW